MARARDLAHADPSLGHDEPAQDPARRRERTRCEACLAFVSAISGYSGRLRLQAQTHSIEAKPLQRATPGCQEGPVAVLGSARQPPGPSGEAWGSGRTDRKEGSFEREGSKIGKGDIYTYMCVLNS